MLNSATRWTLAVVVLLEGAFCQAPQQRLNSEYLAPFVPSPEPIVERMLKAAGLKPGETLYDLGCGDGRILFIAARDFKAKAVGVELSPQLVKADREKAMHLGLDKDVKIIEGNLLDVDISQADVVTVYLLRLSNELLKPNLQTQLKPGARVVSHDFEIMGWKPDLVEKVTAHKRDHTIYVYTMPPKTE